VVALYSIVLLDPHTILLFRPACIVFPCPHRIDEYEETGTDDVFIILVFQKLTSPITWNVFVGLSVPIPTFVYGSKIRFAQLLYILDR
jgi:hypothetical protein